MNKNNVQMVKNYYEILGVKTKSTNYEIKKAFHRLALFYHPDKNNEPGAKEQYIRIHEAYEYLSDEKKRAKYENSLDVKTNYYKEEAMNFTRPYKRNNGGGGGGFGGGGVNGGGGSPNSNNFGNRGKTKDNKTRNNVGSPYRSTNDKYNARANMPFQSDYMRTQYGANKSKKSEFRTDFKTPLNQTSRLFENISKCDAIRLANMFNLPEHGRLVPANYIMVTPNRHFDYYYSDVTVDKDLFVSLKEIDRGCLKLVHYKRQCHSSNNVEARILEIIVPPGCLTGTKFIFLKQGDHIEGRSRGHIIFTLKVKPHIYFERVDDTDLKYMANISHIDAVNGTTIYIPTLQGLIMTLNTKGELITTKTIKRITGKGLPMAKDKTKRGDLLVGFNIRPSHEIL